MTRLNNPLAALRHKNFLYFLTAMSISLIGTWMQNIAQPWLALELTGSPLKISLIGALQFTPVLFFSVFAGVIIDKFPKKKILMLTQTASLVITFSLAMLVYTGQVQYWHILVSATLLGFVNTIDMPTRQAFVIELVEREDLMNAIALNSTMFNAARILGPAIAGLVMARFGVFWAFLINSASFAAVILVMFLIKPNCALAARPKAQSKVWADIADGFRYLRTRAEIVTTLSYVLVVATFGANFGVLVPVLAKLTLGSDEKGFGFMMSFIGVGSLIASVFVAALSKHGPKRIFLVVMPFLVGAFNIVTGLTHNFYFAAAALALTGFAFVSFSANANSSIQLNTDDAYRGRVMSIYTLIFSGLTPLGNLYTGAITDKWGSSMGFYASGGIVLVLMTILVIYEIARKKRPPVNEESADTSVIFGPDDNI